VSALAAELVQLKLEVIATLGAVAGVGMNDPANMYWQRSRRETLLRAAECLG